MAPSTALTVKAEGDSPYQLSSEQTLKASKALLAHIKLASAEKSKSTEKKSLLPTDEAEDEEEDDSLSMPIWLTLTTKKHINDTRRLKPSRIAVPHSLNTSPNLRICLIVADPQRTYKDLVASPAFPAALSARISKVVGLQKLKKKWTQYEAQRKLLAEHDIFLADDRSMPSLPKVLGKTFYKSTAKRPIPVSISGPAPKDAEGKKIERVRGEKGPRPAGSAKQIAAEIEKALSSALIHLSPSVSTAIRVGYSAWSPEKVAANVEAVVTETVERFVPKKWRGVRALHIKGPETAALPIWLADELWEEEDDVIDNEEYKKKKEANVGKKRKTHVLEEGKSGEGEGNKKQKLLKESNDDVLDREIRERKERLRAQKEQAEKEIGGEVLVEVKTEVKKVKVKKGKKGVTA